MMPNGSPVPDDERRDPALERAVAALRPLPPSSADAVARVVAAAERGAVLQRQRRARRAATWRVAGALGAVAAGLALLVVVRRPLDRPTADRPIAAHATSERPPTLANDIRPVDTVRPGTPVLVARASVGATDAPQLVTFRLDRPRASAVTVVGDFNQWNAHATRLARDANGAWTAVVPLTPGRHAYRFVVDDSLRVLDPRAPAERDAELGVARSVVVVGVP